MKKRVLILGMLATLSALYAGMGNMQVQAEELPDEVFTVTVVSGTTGEEFVMQADYHSGEEVIIDADAPPEEMVFDKWITSDGVVFADKEMATTTFIMPEKPVTVTATYKKLVLMQPPKIIDPIIDEIPEDIIEDDEIIVPKVEPIVIAELNINPISLTAIPTVVVNDVIAPKTGDDFPIGVICAIMLLSGGAVWGINKLCQIK